uniref:Uncharacterized protein n=1 Tax=Physcomitrium patens TaxID=3218 RepID=A0A2K1JKY0_PHYPA|nr:hypothetical protein PHYPA_017020 [Physcomitrium patens]
MMYSWLRDSQERPGFSHLYLRQPPTHPHSGFVTAPFLQFHCSSNSIVARESSSLRHVAATCSLSLYHCVFLSSPRIVFDAGFWFRYSGVYARCCC